ncbi:tRNA (N(6)-L-threonylcarbamoyladenosine(37)-C(2))-methylthiotransferase MtaB [uncultured Oscillibacter sp.]|uniref:tRNA (N(6)-L-threonylcarbamoyladenosine(37)-C(2))- methylthiotransferase MtaB n=1 Tax=uncultured Oscillibacter sp. TaxID=876091 RepID=UPI0025FC45F7|nr:tRNA (N(6)-L-threonylcarbamoyladenosine(37)-C(2))-methylthiotransferase MtaB [uncultured Oscillibacter sp.]
MKIAIYTLGCKVNQYETQAMEQELRRRGHEVVPFSGDADAYVVNTCSVTAVSDQKSRQMLSRARREHPQAVVAVCGCYAQTHPEDVRKLDVDLIAGTGDRMGFLDLLEQELEDRRPMESMDRAFDRREFEVLPAGGLEGRTRAMLKVEDGCVNFCSYCIIPYARGPVRSLPLETAVRRARELDAAGYREIVLTGIEISSWGRDLKNGTELIDLIEGLCAAAPGLRLRLGSLEPRTVTEEFCRRAAALPALCPQFHLSMQSGCDATLRRMNRKYDTARYLESVTLLNRYFDRPAVTTDMIVGFPGETEEEFSASLTFIRRCGFAKMHIFPYSIRPGTPAAEMEQIPRAVKEARAKRAAEAAEEMHRAYLLGCVGQVYPVLYEQARDGRYSGHAPNYMEVLVSKDPALHNRVIPTRITGVDGSALLGELEETV